jgi:hypothetical protein
MLKTLLKKLRTGRTATGAFLVCCSFREEEKCGSKKFLLSENKNYLCEKPFSQPIGGK